VYSIKSDITESVLQLAHFFIQEPLQKQLLLLRIRHELIQVLQVLGWAPVKGLHSAGRLAAFSLYFTVCRL
jgi:hypothetical protein